MNLRSTSGKLLLAAWLLACITPSIALAHIPIPPKRPSDIGRRVVKTALADFTLIDQDGKLFQFSGTRGKLVLVTFIFTTCPDVCPLLTAKFAAIQRALDDKKIKNYWLLSITTDPERDSSNKLKEYGARFKADFRKWSFLTGTRQDLAKVWKNFHVNVTKTQAGDVIHTTLATLVDRRGVRRVDYYGDKWQDKEVLKDLQWLATEK